MALETPIPEGLAGSAAGSKASSLISMAFLMVSVGFAVAGQMILKAAMDRVGRIGSAEVAAFGEYVGRAAREPRLWLGMFLFGVSGMFWLVVLSRVPLSLAYPFVGLSYVAVVLLSRFILGEQVPALRWIGVLVVAAGLVIIGLSARSVRG